MRPIEPGDKVTGLSLGDEQFTPLKIFLQRQAKSYSDQLLAKSYGLFEGDKIVGYITLVCGEIAAEDAEADFGDAVFHYKHYPAIKIARLAIDRRQRGLGLGRSLVDFALGMAKQEISSMIGCRFVVLDAKAASVSFYTRLGFRLLDTEVNRTRSEPIMFVDLLRV